VVVVVEEGERGEEEEEVEVEVEVEAAEIERKEATGTCEAATHFPFASLDSELFRGSISLRGRIDIAASSPVRNSGWVGAGEVYEPIRMLLFLLAKILSTLFLWKFHCPFSLARKFFFFFFFFLRNHGVFNEFPFY